MTTWAQENLPTPKTIDQAVAERNGWCETAAQHHRNEEYYRGLVIQIGEMLGKEAYVSDDGSVQDGVLCAKVPAMVRNLVESLRAWHSFQSASNTSDLYNLASRIFGAKFDPVEYDSVE